MTILAIERPEQKTFIIEDSAHVAQDPPIRTALQAIAAAGSAPLATDKPLLKIRIICRDRTIEVTPEQAFKHFLTQAEKDDVNSMVHVGENYQDGQGTKQDYGKAREWFLKAAKHKTTPSAAQAMWYLGRMYQVGLGVEPDHNETLYWYLKAAKAGLVRAMWDVGRIYDGELSIKPDYLEAKKWHEKAAAFGSSGAMTSLGEMLAKGRHGIDPNPSKAVNWLLQASLKLNLKAMCLLGRHFQLGIGIEQDLKEAERLFKHVADHGVPEAMTFLGNLYRQGPLRNDQLAFDYFRQAAEKGDLPSMYNVALCFQMGKGVEENTEKALEWFTRAAKKDHVESMNVLGILYTAIHRYEEAAKWLQKAADTGHISAINSLAVLYEEGLGVHKNVKKALKLYAQAAEGGEVSAMFNLGMGYKSLRDDKQALVWFRKSAEKGYAPAKAQLGYAFCQGAQRNYTEAAKWHLQAAEEGETLSTINLALLYRYGKGVPKDYAKALKWFKQAAEKDVPEALYNLGEMHEQGLGTTPDIALAKDYYHKAIRKGHTVALDALANLCGSWKEMLQFRIDHF